MREKRVRKLLRERGEDARYKINETKKNEGQSGRHPVKTPCLVKIKCR